jgi:hypothetical protein
MWMWMRYSIARNFYEHDYDLNYIYSFSLPLPPALRPPSLSIQFYTFSSSLNFSPSTSFSISPSPIDFPAFISSRARTRPARSALYLSPHFHSRTISGTKRHARSDSRVNDHPADNHRMSTISREEEGNVPAPKASNRGVIPAVPAAPNRHL